jgi:predicted nucleic acid-binding protein
VTASFVLDSSAIVAMLVDGGETGDWVAATAGDGFLAAPALAMFETANILRRLQLAGRLERVESTLAHREVLALPLQLWPYPAVADRAWELRETLTTYDASYVALAELLDARLVTLDRRLTRASGPRCAILTPPQGE